MSACKCSDELTELSIAAYAAIALSQKAQLVSLDSDLLDPGLAVHPSVLLR
jgi:hypothetical protein